LPIPEYGGMPPSARLTTIARNRRYASLRVRGQRLRRQRTEQRELDEHRVDVVGIGLQLERALRLPRALEALRGHRRRRLIRDDAADLFPERRQELRRRTLQLLRDLLERFLRVPRFRCDQALGLAHVLGDVERRLRLLRLVDERPRRESERARPHLTERLADLRCFEPERRHLGIGADRDRVGFEPHHDRAGLERWMAIRARGDRAGLLIRGRLRAERGDPAGRDRLDRIVCDEISHRHLPRRACASRRSATPSACPR
jgi:hypothetical protein